MQFLAYDKFNSLLTMLKKLGFNCLGPQVQNNTIVYDDLNDISQLPWGMQDEQKPGEYCLTKTSIKKAFAWANGAQALKPLLFKPKESLWKVEKDSLGKLTFKNIPPQPKLIAFIGARACDLAALAVQDKTFMQSDVVDVYYKAQREKLLIIAVDCSHASSNCFCVSTNTGPKAESQFDLSLSEVDDGFVVFVGSEKGKKILAQLSCEKATEQQLQQADENTTQASKMQTKKMPLNNSRQLRDILMKNLDHPQWDDVASRCLACGNCTSVCPTCFCHHQTETASLDESHSEHQRQWDSCFSKDHSYIHGKVIREDIKSRYRQWLTHKLGTWWDQFDTSGCVGCGRCVTWCPVGIDITEEMAVMIKSEKNN